VFAFILYPLIVHAVFIKSMLRTFTTSSKV
jgi:hypothetical protein